MPFSRFVRMRSRISAMSASRSTGFCSPMWPKSNDGARAVLPILRVGINGNPRRPPSSGVSSAVSGVYPTLVPANNDLAAGHELLAYGAAVKRAPKTGNVQGPVAHARDPEGLNRHGEGQAAGDDEATSEHDELCVGYVQAHCPIAIQRPAGYGAEDVPGVTRVVAHLINAREMAPRRAVGKERCLETERGCPHPRGQVRHNACAPAVDPADHGR